MCVLSRFVYMASCGGGLKYRAGVYYREANPALAFLSHGENEESVYGVWLVRFFSLPLLETIFLSISKNFVLAIACQAVRFLGETLWKPSRRSVRIFLRLIVWFAI